jgi:hypothetical protein
MVVLIHIVGGILLLTGFIGVVLGLRIRDGKSASYGVVWGTSFAAEWLALFLLGEESEHTVKLLLVAMGIFYAQYCAWSEFR